MFPCDCSEYECKLPNSSICQKDKEDMLIFPYLHPSPEI